MCALRPNGLALPTLTSAVKQQMGGFCPGGANGTGNANCSSPRGGLYRVFIETWTFVYTMVKGKQLANSRALSKKAFRPRRQ